MIEEIDKDTIKFTYAGITVWNKNGNGWSKMDDRSYGDNSTIDFNFSVVDKRWHKKFWIVPKDIVEHESFQGSMDWQGSIGWPGPFDTFEDAEKFLAMARVCCG